MHKRFTDRARKAFQVANRYAQQYNHECTGADHLTLALIEVGTNCNDFERQSSRVKEFLIRSMQYGPDMITMGSMPKTPRLKKVVEYATEEARELRHNYVGTEHLVLGLLRESEGIAAQAMGYCGLSYDKVKTALTHTWTHATPRPMTPDEYQKLAERTSATNDKHSGDVAHAKARMQNFHMTRLLHGAMGLCTEAGELQDQLKRHIFYGTELDHVNIKEECGDILWYVAEVLNALGASMSDVMQANIDKLQARYPDKFDNDKAVNRDLQKELKALDVEEGRQSAPIVEEPNPSFGDGLRRESDTPREHKTCPGCGAAMDAAAVCPDCATTGRARFLP